MAAAGVISFLSALPLPEYVSSASRELVSSPVTFSIILYLALWILIKIFSKRSSGYEKLMVMILVLFGVSTIINMNLELSPNTFKRIQIHNSTSLSDARQQINELLNTIEQETDPTTYYWAKELAESFELDYYKKIDLYIRYGEGFDLLNPRTVNPDTVVALEFSKAWEVFGMYLMLILLALIYELNYRISPGLKHFFTVFGFVFMMMAEIIFIENLDEDDEMVTIFSILKYYLDEPYIIHPQARMWMRHWFVTIFVLSSVWIEMIIVPVQEQVMNALNKFTKNLTVEVNKQKTTKSCDTRQSRNLLHKLNDMLPKFFQLKDFDFVQKQEIADSDLSWFAYFAFWMAHNLLLIIQKVKVTPQ